MNSLESTAKSERVWLGRLRLMAIVSGTLILTACQAERSGIPITPVAMQCGESLPEEATRGTPGDGYTRPGNVPQFMQEQCPTGLPFPTTTYGPWKPPGISGPWPPDEYLCDGGDRMAQIRVRSDFRIDGMLPEDAIAHYDTIDGRTVVQPTNRVCIYAPRFAAVRKVDISHDENQLDATNKIDQPTGVVLADERQLAFSSMQPLEPQKETVAKPVGAMVHRQTGIDLSNEQLAVALQDRLKPYEDFSFIRTGILEEDDKPILAQRVQAAITWSADQGLQVTMERRRAVVSMGDDRAEAVFTIDVPNHPKLQLCKIASTDNARPGETVDFTIRFDNVGDQKIGNVTIVDSLTTRLEYVPDSAQSSRKAEFSAKENDAGSALLRWELADPLGAGEGGAVHFQCKVR